MEFDIIEYMGQVDGGIFVLLSLNYRGKFFEGIFYYKEHKVALTIEKTLENLLGCKIEDYEDYKNLMLSIISKVLPYDEAKNTIGEFDKNHYKVIFNDNQ